LITHGAMSELGPARSHRLNPIRVLDRTLVRFTLVGGLCTAIHVIAFQQLLRALPAEAANLLAFAAATQVNFLLSYRWTWRGRFSGVKESGRAVARRLVAFYATAATSMSVNAAAFSFAFRVLDASPMVAVGAAVCVSAGLSYALGSRVTFASRILRRS
jgi:putative flippase GtrA